MDFQQSSASAQANFLALTQNVYPGRGIIVGLDETSQHLIQVYWIMGRSENSRNRVFKADNETGRLYTEAADASKMQDPSLIIYNAMRERVPHYVVSNGDQTDTVLKEMRGHYALQSALATRTHEPDAPNFTQRITAMSSLHMGGGFVQLSVLRKSALGEGCDRLTYEYNNPPPGFGFCVTTYSGDGNPLPPFRGDPLLMPLAGGMKDVAQNYWDALDKDNRVALAVKFIEQGNGRSDIHIINKF